MSHSHSSHSSRSSEKKSDFLCKWRFFNTLPDVPFDPKLLHFPFEKNRFVKYTTTALESQHKSILHTEPDLGVPIDLIDPFAYKTPTKPAALDEADAKLLQTDEKQQTSSNGQKGQAFRPVASWLRKTEYISGAFSESKRDLDKER
jgi:RNA polymerase II-associated factor 1